MRWMPSLYFTKGILYAFVFVVALIMLRRTGLSIDETTFYIGLCYLPWVAKCWWKPLVARTKNCWQLILLIELLLVPAFSMLAFALPTEWKTVALLLLIAFFTAIHNVAVDMLCKCLVSSRSGNYQVVRELSRKMADIVCIGIFIMFVGNLQVVYRNALLYSWRTMVFIMSFLMLLLFFWHLIVLPRHSCKELPSCDEPKFERSKSMLAFVLLFLFAPTMINKMSVLFLISNQSSGGLGLSPQELGFVLGTIGVIALTFGMMSGRRLRSRWSLRALVLPMAALLIVPPIVYVTLSFWQPSNFYLISTCVFFEQAAYGIALSGYLALLRKLRNGNIAKSLMALSMMIACMLSGTIQMYSSYFHFFLVTLGGWLLTFAAAFLVWRSLAGHTTSSDKQ